MKKIVGICFVIMFIAVGFSSVSGTNNNSESSKQLNVENLDKSRDSVWGYCFDSSGSVSDAYVYLEMTDCNDYSDSSGYYSFDTPAIPYFGYLCAKKSGYINYRKFVIINPLRTYWKNIIMFRNYHYVTPSNIDINSNQQPILQPTTQQTTCQQTSTIQQTQTTLQIIRGNFLNRLIRR